MTGYRHLQIACQFASFGRQEQRITTRRVIRPTGSGIEPLFSRIGMTLLRGHTMS